MSTEKIDFIFKAYTAGLHVVMGVSQKINLLVDQIIEADDNDDFDPRSFVRGVERPEWHYKTREVPGDYGPYRLDVYHWNDVVDYHTAIESEEESNRTGEFWVDWLSRCSAKLPCPFGTAYDEWYPKAYRIMYGL